ncbi:MAG: carbon starvation protein A [Verrucomicrobiota bacterium]
MPILLIALGALVAYLVAYHTYGRWLARKIFRVHPDNEVPSRQLEDGSDFVPTSRSVVFGHHFTSIAGTGPIVGPALAVIWGWLPALLWVLLGSIFIGAVHDFSALMVSLRNRGQTVGDIAGRVLSQRSRVLFLSVLFLALTIVLAIFGLVIASVFRLYPQSIFPCLLQIPIALAIGYFLHRQGAGLLLPSLATLALMYLAVAFGNQGPLGAFNQSLAAWPLVQWVIVLLLYSWIASVLPVWSLLQPRDYINSLQLVSTLGLLFFGLVAAALWGLESDGQTRPLALAAPTIQSQPEGAPSLFPFLFITIACGAISGFHCLVSSGTSSKQLRSEADAQFVGFGSMLTEGFLAVMVILACVAGLGLGAKELVAQPETGKLMASQDLVYGADAYLNRYQSWAQAGGLAEKLGAFVEGSANFLRAFGLPLPFAVALMGVFVASFAATTLDTACRLQRYVVQELAASLGGKADARKTPLDWLTGKHGATIFAITIAAVIATIPMKPGAPAGTGGMILWPLFGATNQLLGGLAFVVVAFWLRRRHLPIAFLQGPMILMLLLPAVALSINLIDFWSAGSWLLVAFGIATLALELWILIEVWIAWPRIRGVLEEPLPPLRPKPKGARSC